MKDKLLDSLIDNTLRDRLQWTLRPYMFNSETEHYYQCILRDETEIQIYISLDKENLIFSGCQHIKILNKNLVNGDLYISGYGNSKVRKIGQIVYDKYIKPNIAPKTKTQDQILLDIIDAIPTKQESRDKKITEIVGSEPEKMEHGNESENTNSTPIIEEKNIKPKSKLGKIIDILFGE